MKTKIGTEVAHVTCDSDTTFKVKRSKVKVTRLYRAALLTAALTRQAAAAVSVETYWPWDLLLRCGLHSAGAVCSAARGASAPTEGREGRGHIVSAARLQLVTSAVYWQGHALSVWTVTLVFASVSVTCVWSRGRVEIYMICISIFDAWFMILI